MKKIILLLTLLTNLYFLHAQEVRISGLIKQPANERLRASIVVNDTINKLTKLDSTDFTRRNSIFKEGKLIAINDDNGHFTITAKRGDSIFFRFGRLYHPEKHSVSDLLQRKEIIIDPQPIPCISVKKCDQKKPSKIYIFVGKKVDVSYVDTTLYCNEIWDSKYRAVYKIDQEFGTHYPKPIITFTSYDHNSTYESQFKNHVNVLIFIGEYCDELIHLKYEFFPVYKTTDGRWATPVDSYMENFNKNTELKPIPISFDKSLTYDYPVDLSEQQLEWRFSKKYYKIENGKAIPIMGRYAEDLVKLWNEQYK